MRWAPLPNLFFQGVDLGPGSAGQAVASRQLPASAPLRGREKGRVLVVFAQRWVLFAASADGHGRRPKVSRGRSRCRGPQPGPAAAVAGSGPPRSVASPPKPRGPAPLTPCQASPLPNTFFSSFSLAPGGTPRMSYSFVSATFAMAAGRAALREEGDGADGAEPGPQQRRQQRRPRETARGKRGRG